MLPCIINFRGDKKKERIQPGVSKVLANIYSMNVACKIICLLEALHAYFSERLKCDSANFIFNALAD